MVPGWTVAFILEYGLTVLGTVCRHSVIPFCKFFTVKWHALCSLTLGLHPILWQRVQKSPSPVVVPALSNWDPSWGLLHREFCVDTPEIQDIWPVPSLPFHHGPSCSYLLGSVSIPLLTCGFCLPAQHPHINTIWRLYSWLNTPHSAPGITLHLEVLLSVPVT